MRALGRSWVVGRSVGFYLTLGACLFVGSAQQPRPASAEAPPGRYLLTERTVGDTRTGLMWMKDFVSFARRSQAVTFCSDSTIAGYRDWRVPTIPELLSLFDVTSPAPMIDRRFFPGTVEEYSRGFFSATPSPYTHPDPDGTYWFASYREGGISDSAPAANIRCVRNF